MLVDDAGDASLRAVEGVTADAVGFGDIEPAIREVQPQWTAQTRQQRLARVRQRIAVGIPAQQHDIPGVRATDQQIAGRPATAVRTATAPYQARRRTCSTVPAPSSVDAVTV